MTGAPSLAGGLADAARSFFVRRAGLAAARGSWAADAPSVPLDLSMDFRELAGGAIRP